MDVCEDHKFLQKNHIKFLRRVLSILPPRMATYDASRMTVLFFALSGLDILGALEEVPQQEVQEIITWIYSLQLTLSDGCDSGGFRGGHCITGIERGNLQSAFANFNNIEQDKNKISNCFNKCNDCSTNDDKHCILAYSENVNTEVNQCHMSQKLSKCTCNLTNLAHSQCLKQTLEASDRSSRTGCKSPLDAGHIAMTYTALASLVVLGDDLSRVNKQAVLQHVSSLQCPDGSFLSNTGGSENDLRFVYCAAVICYILGDTSAINVEAAVHYITSCLSYSGALGQGAGEEGHGGSIYCGVAALLLLGQHPEQHLPVHHTIRWLVSRQVEGADPSGMNTVGGGLQGRPNKPADTCYTFWVGAALKMLGQSSLLDAPSLRRFVLSTQDPITGGLGKYSSAEADGLHTYLGLSGLAVLGLQLGLREVIPTLNITERAARHLQALRGHVHTGTDKPLC